MAKYVYPAVFTPDQGNGYSVLFQDLENCYTSADSLEHAIEMAEDALALVLYRYENDGRPIPIPSKHSDIPLTEGSFVNYIACDTLEYRKIHNNKAVKKTLTIPEWLNEAASAQGINFSQALQDALKAQLQL